MAEIIGMSGSTILFLLDTTDNCTGHLSRAITMLLYWQAGEREDGWSVLVYFFVFQSLQQ